ncbi:MAG: fructose-6-phosphate aldolase [Candidatus Methylomirabilales bacterium]
MKIFLDTANVKEIKEAVELGVLDGVTTNPSLIAKEGRDFVELVQEICGLVPGPVNVEVVATEADGMLEEARGLAKLHPNVVVKLPMTKEGLKAVKGLSAEGIRTNVTLVFSPNQALLAAKTGASFVSPFLGRLDDIGHRGMDLVRQILLIYRNYGFPTQVIAASIRNPLHVVEAAEAGAHIVTMPWAVLSQLFKHPLTDIGLERFLADWEKMQRKT